VLAALAAGDASDEAQWAQSCGCCCTALREREEAPRFVPCRGGVQLYIAPLRPGAGPVSARPRARVHLRQTPNHTRRRWPRVCVTNAARHGFCFILFGCCGMCRVSFVANDCMSCAVYCCDVRVAYTHILCWWHPASKNLLRLEAGYPALRCHNLEEEHLPRDLKKYRRGLGTIQPVLSEIISQNHELGVCTG